MTLEIKPEPNSVIFSGMLKGRELRKSLKLENLDAAPCTVTIRIPDNVVSLNASFCIGLFSESIKQLGEAQFRTKYKFECPDDILEDVNDGIEQIVTLNSIVTLAGSEGREHVPS